MWTVWPVRSWVACLWNFMTVVRTITYMYICDTCKLIRMVTIWWHNNWTNNDVCNVTWSRDQTHVSNQPSSSCLTSSNWRVGRSDPRGVEEGHQFRREICCECQNDCKTARSLSEIHLLPLPGWNLSQKDGAAMDWPVSAVEANLYMGWFKLKALISATSKPRMWMIHALFLGDVYTSTFSVKNEYFSLRFSLLFTPKRWKCIP